MKRLKKLMPKFTKNEEGQGATEYILLLVVVVAIAMIFKDKIQSTVKDKVTEVSGQIQGFTGGN